MPPLERLSYYPGQRLDAADLNLESIYELTVRRLLNQGLFSAGVVSGLEVTKTAPREVTVEPGLALDPKGRELYLSDSIALAVPNQKPAGGGDSYYLVVTYDETKVGTGDSGCAVPEGVKAFSRIREAPQLAFTADWPNPKLCADAFPDLNCGIVLATVALDNNCQVASIDTGVRQYSFPTHSSQVHEAAFEGEEDIAPGEPKRLFFHVRGGSPTGVILYLRGARFSQLYYTELGWHNHSFTAVSGTETGDSTRSTVDLNHKHDVSGSDTKSTGSGGIHNHLILTPNVATGTAIGTFSIPLGNAGMYGYWDHNQPPFNNPPDPPWVRSEPGHTHVIGLSGQNTTTQDTKTSAMDHKHPFDASGAKIGDFGVSDVAAKGGPTELGISFIEDLTVTLDGIDVTTNLLQSIVWAAPLGGPTFNSDKGTGPIDLLRLPPISGQPLPPIINEGQHVIEFSVSKGGGKLLYNLYVE